MSDPRPPGRALAAPTSKPFVDLEAGRSISGTTPDSSSSQAPPLTGSGGGGGGTTDGALNRTISPSSASTTTTTTAIPSSSTPKPPSSPCTHKSKRSSQVNTAHDRNAKDKEKRKEKDSSDLKEKGPTTTITSTTTTATHNGRTGAPSDRRRTSRESNGVRVTSRSESTYMSPDPEGLVVRGELTPFWRKWGLLIAFLVLLILVGAIVGGIVGARKSKAGPIGSVQDTLVVTLQKTTTQTRTRTSRSADGGGGQVVTMTVTETMTETTTEVLTMTVGANETFPSAAPLLDGKQGSDEDEDELTVRDLRPRISAAPGG